MIKRVDNPGFAEERAPFDARPTVAATEAKNRFGELLDMARSEPVHIQKNGRDVAVLVSAEEYRRLIAGEPTPKVRPLVEELLERSIQRRRSLYETLAR